MATATLTGSLAYSGNQSLSVSASKQQTQTGTDYTAQSQVIGTSAEQIDLGSDIGTLGWLMIKNEDATNFVEIALDSGVSTQKFAKLRAGEFIVFPPSTATLYAKADTANCIISVLAIEF